MYLTELNKSFSELDRKIIHYINEIQTQMLAQAKEHALLLCKYKLGFIFTHLIKTANNIYLSKGFKCSWAQQDVYLFANDLISKGIVDGVWKNL